MPKFLWTVIIAFIAFSAILLRFAATHPPEPAQNLVIFFILLFVCLVLFFSFPIYFVKYRQAPKLTDLRNIYRSSLKLSTFMATVVVAFGILRAVRAASIPNLILMTIFFLVVYKVLFKR